MRIALTELGTSSDSEYGAYGLRFIRALNVTGLGPEEVVGTMTTDPDKWSIAEQFARFAPVRSDLPDSMSPRIKVGASMIVERQFCKVVMEAGKKKCGSDGVQMDKLIKLRDALQGNQAVIAEAAHLLLKAEALAAVRPMLDGDAETSSTALRALQSAFPQEAASAFKDLASAKVEADSVAPRAAKAMEASLKKTQAELSMAGVLVTNWEREVKVSGGVKAGEDVQGTFSKTRKIGGFLILGEPRITSLQLGDDLVTRLLEDATAPPIGAERIFETHRNYITHYQLRARQVVFAESYQSALHASLQVDIAAILQKLEPVTGMALKAQLQAVSAKVDALYAAISAASESGAMDASGSYVETHDFSFARDKMNGFVEEEMKLAQGTLPVISIRLSLDDYINKSRARLGSATR